MKIMIDCWFAWFLFKDLGRAVISGVVLRCRIRKLPPTLCSRLSILHLAIGSSLKPLIEIKGYTTGVQYL